MSSDILTENVTHCSHETIYELERFLILKSVFMFKNVAHPIELMLGTSTAAILDRQNDSFVCELKQAEDAQILTFALNESLDEGIFSGPSYTARCLHPALARTYLGWVPWRPRTCAWDRKPFM